MSVLSFLTLRREAAHVWRDEKQTRYADVLSAVKRRMFGVTKNKPATRLFFAP